MWDQQELAWSVGEKPKTNRPCGCEAKTQLKPVEINMICGCETSRKWDQQELACSVGLRPAETFIILTKADWSMCKARHCVHDYRSEILGYSQPECGEYGNIHVIGVMCFNGVNDVMCAHLLHSLIIVPTPMFNEYCSFMVQHYIPSNTIVDPMLV